MDSRAWWRRVPRPTTQKDHSRAWAQGVAGSNPVAPTTFRVHRSHIGHISSSAHPDPRACRSTLAAGGQRPSQVREFNLTSSSARRKHPGRHLTRQCGPRVAPTGSGRGFQIPPHLSGLAGLDGDSSSNRKSAACRTDTRSVISVRTICCSVAYESEDLCRRQLAAAVRRLVDGRLEPV